MKFSVDSAFHHVQYLQTVIFLTCYYVIQDIFRYILEWAMKFSVDSAFHHVQYLQTVIFLTCY